MNTDVRHLDLADLIAEANGQAIGDQAREHLAACEHCRAEANRWDLVASGVRTLMDATPQVAQPARPWHAGPRVITGPRRRPALAVSAAAALLLIGGASYGVSAALTGHAPRAASTTAALTSVSGCHGLKQADGTLEQVKGTSLVIKTPSGEPVTATTTASAKVSLLGLPLSYITDGMKVTVAGLHSSRAIDAQHVTIGGPPAGPLRVPPGFVLAHGTVTRAGATGFILVTARGTPIPVATSNRTQVDIPPPNATLSTLRIGIATIAIGHAGPHGTLSAMGVLQQTGGPGTIRVGNCSPGSIDAAITTGLAAGG